MSPYWGRLPQQGVEPSVARPLQALDINVRDKTWSHPFATGANWPGSHRSEKWLCSLVFQLSPTSGKVWGAFCSHHCYLLPWYAFVSREESCAHPLNFLSRVPCLFLLAEIPWNPCCVVDTSSLSPQSVKDFAQFVFSIGYFKRRGGDMSSCLEHEWFLSINSQFSLLFHCHQK